MFDVLKEEEKRKRDTHTQKLKSDLSCQLRRAIKHSSSPDCWIKLSEKMSAVEVRGGYKFYGKEKDPKIVLNRLNMTVTHGSM